MKVIFCKSCLDVLSLSKYKSIVNDLIDKRGFTIIDKDNLIKHFNGVDF